MLDALAEQETASQKPDYVIGNRNVFRDTMARLGLSKPRWDPDAKQRWDEASGRGELGKMEDAPPGFVAEYVRACSEAAERARRITRYL